VQIKAVESAGKLLNVELEILEVRSATNLNESIVAASSKGVDALLMTSSPVFGANPERIAGLTLGLRLPAVSLFPDFARAGGLIAYGVDPVKNWREGATLIAKEFGNCIPDINPFAGRRGDRMRAVRAAHINFSSIACTAPCALGRSSMSIKSSIRKIKNRFDAGFGLTRLSE
jgi:hypothetical protein